MTEPQFLNRVVLTNFKSIAHCDVSMARPCSFLVGPNDSGKSNFLDSLSFATDSLRMSLEHALQNRGGFAEVRHRSREADRVGMRLDATLGRASFRYAFTIGQLGRRDAQVLREDCSVTDTASARRTTYFSVRNGRVVRSNVRLPPATSPHQLYLSRAAAIAEFRPLYDGLASMRFYNFSPAEIRRMQSPGPDPFLNRSGDNAATVLLALENRSPELKQRLDEYLRVIAPGIRMVRHKAMGGLETIEFHKDSSAIAKPTIFRSVNMSDGVLRALGLLLAVFQCADDDPSIPRVVGIEEPELALHPNSIEVLADILDEASIHTQLVVECHSSDLLDRTGVPADSILAFEDRHGMSHIGPLDENEVQVIRNGIQTPGELIRMNLLRLPSPVFQMSPPPSRFFDFDASPDAEDSRGR